nr:hypothetical protein [Tanacetum cinerariifolium]
NEEMLKEYAGLVILLWVYLQNLQLLDAWYMLGIVILWSDISGITLVESATCISYFLTNSEQSNPVRTLAFRAKKVNIVVAEWSAMNALKFYIYVYVLAASDRKFVLLGFSCRNVDNGYLFLAFSWFGSSYLVLDISNGVLDYTLW